VTPLLQNASSIADYLGAVGRMIVEIPMCFVLLRLNRFDIQTHNPSAKYWQKMLTWPKPDEP
jgi:hypothetical protein